MPQTGIEPVREYKSRRIFKSCASASSATAAYKANRANSFGVVYIDAKHRVTLRDYTTQIMIIYYHEMGPIGLEPMTLCL